MGSITVNTSTLNHTPCQVVENRQLAADLFSMRIHAPGLYTSQSKRIQPGHFIHLNCGSGLTLPRPFSIMDSDPEKKIVDLFYRVVGKGTQNMSTWKNNHTTTLLGPIGTPFTLIKPPHCALLVAGGVGLAPLDFLARTLAKRGVSVVLLWGIESQSPFPTITGNAWTGTESGDLALAHLQELGIISRLTSLDPRPGHYRGYVTDLVKHYLNCMGCEEHTETVLYTCGPTSMMNTLSNVAKHQHLRGEASLEAFMACAFGGCAGCVAPILDGEGGWNYKKVCVDGPVFPLESVDWGRIK